MHRVPSAVNVVRFVVEGPVQALSSCRRVRASTTFTPRPTFCCLIHSLRPLPVAHYAFNLFLFVFLLACLCVVLCCVSRLYP